MPLPKTSHTLACLGTTLLLNSCGVVAEPDPSPTGPRPAPLVQAGQGRNAAAQDRAEHRLARAAAIQREIDEVKASPLEGREKRARIGPLREELRTLEEPVATHWQLPPPLGPATDDDHKPLTMAQREAYLQELAKAEKGDAQAQAGLADYKRKVFGR